MKSKKKNLIYSEKIEIDEKTNEPSIISVPLEDFDEEKPIIKTVKNEDVKNIYDPDGKQLVMQKVFGVSEADKSLDKRQLLFKKIFTAIFIVFVVSVLAYTFYNDFFAPNSERDLLSIDFVIETLKYNWFYGIFAIIALGFCYFLKALKLSVMCKSMTKRFHFKTCFQTAIIGHYYNYVTPLAVGGQPFEIYHLSKNGVHGGIASSLPIATFFLYQLAFVILGIVSLALLPFNTFTEATSKFPTFINVLSTIGLVCCLFMPSLVILFSIIPRFGSMIVKLVMYLAYKLKLVKNYKAKTFGIYKTVIHNSKCLRKLATSPITFILSLLISFCEHLALCSIAYFTLRFFGFDLVERGFIEWLLIIQLCMILYAAISFIPTPGNSGAADLSFYVLFSIGLKSGLAFPAMVIWRILSYYSFIIIGFIFIRAYKRKEKK